MATIENPFRTSVGIGRVIGPVLSAICLVVQPGFAQEADCAFFSKKTVELVVPFSPGGGYDVYARMVARYMGDELGAANMIVRNQPGAGGLLAANQTWAARPDGLRVQMMSVSGMLAAELGGADGVAFRTADFAWIGRVSAEPDIVATSPGRSIESLDALKPAANDGAIRIGSTGIGSPQYISAALLARVLERKSEIVTGFSGAPEVYASLKRGELDLFSSSLSAAVAAEKAETARIVWVLGRTELPGRPDVTPVAQVVDPKFLPLIDTHEKAVAAGRALAAPPGLPADRLQCLRGALDRAMSSQALLAEADNLDRPVTPLDGVRLEAAVKEATAHVPEGYLAVLREAYAR